MANTQRTTGSNQQKALKLYKAGKTLSEISEAIFGDRDHLNPCRQMLALAGVNYQSSRPETVSNCLRAAYAHFAKSSELYRKGGR
jgi:hypothetical protein